MKLLQHVAFIGNYLPRRCGIATFTQDLHRAVSTARPHLETCVVAMTDSDRTYDYPPAVRFEIHDETIDDYVKAAEFLNVSRPYLIGLLEAGEIPYRMVGTHRRVRFEDLREYRRRDDLKHRQAADELTQLSEELGLY